MRLYDEKIKLLRRLRDDCNDTYAAGRCNNCPASDGHGKCCLAGEPLFWRIEAIGKRKAPSAAATATECKVKYTPSE